MSGTFTALLYVTLLSIYEEVFVMTAKVISLCDYRKSKQEERRLTSAKGRGSPKDMEIGPDDCSMGCGGCGDDMSFLCGNCGNTEFKEEDVGDADKTLCLGCGAYVFVPKGEKQILVSEDQTRSQLICDQCGNDTFDTESDSVGGVTATCRSCKAAAYFPRGG